MSAHEIEQAVAQGYSKGYAAGRRRNLREISDERKVINEDALWQRAMLAAVPFAMQQNSWADNGKPISTLHERVKLACDVADAVVKIAGSRGRVKA